MNQTLKGALLVTLVLVTAWSALAQRRTGAISGTVIDESGAVVGRVQVTATHVRTGETRSATSDASGIYRLPLLEVGEVLWWRARRAPSKRRRRP
jgi:hypothetical protein